jgi:hypothetical protein
MSLRSWSLWRLQPVFSKPLHGSGNFKTRITERRPNAT